MKCGPAPRGPSKKGRFCFLWGITSIQSTVCTEQNNYQATITIRYHIAEVPYYDNVHCIRLARLRLCWLVLGHCHVHLWGGHLITIDNCSADLLCRGSSSSPQHYTNYTALYNIHYSSNDVNTFNTFNTANTANILNLYVGSTVSFSKDDFSQGAVN